MNLQSTTMGAALALFPVYPPQWVSPVQPSSIAHGGIPLSAFTLLGLEIVIEPITGLQNWVMAAFDVVTLFVNGVRTNVSKTIMPGEEGNRFLLYLPELWFTNGVNDVRYQVTRVSGNKDDSPTLQLLYHKPAPTITVSHPPSIGPGQPAVITLTVGYARPYDTVTLTIGAWNITFTNPDHTKPITHTLTAAELQQIGEGTHPVSARAIDQLTNSNQSGTTFMDIRVSPAPLTIDTSDLELKGLRVNTNGLPSGLEPIGNSTVRKAQGGTGTHQYTSSSQAVSVEQNGTVTGLKNGSAVITVTDQASNSVSYRVFVSNIWVTQFIGWSDQTYDNYLKLLSESGLLPINNELRAVLQRCYIRLEDYTNQPRRTSWTGGAKSGDFAEAYHHDTGIYFMQNVKTDSLGLGFKPDSLDG